MVKLAGGVKQTRQEASKLLSRVPDEFVFKCHDSCVMHDMKELQSELSIMDEQTFAYHANQTKNDFSNWVNDIIRDQELANSLKKARNPREAARLVQERIDFLNRRVTQKV